MSTTEIKEQISQMSREERNKVMEHIILLKQKEEMDEMSGEEEHEELKQIVLSRKNPAFLKYLD